MTICNSFGVGLVAGLGF